MDKRENDSHVTSNLTQSQLSLLLLRNLILVTGWQFGRFLQKEEKIILELQIIFMN